jgi:hypothetical protein
MVFFWFIIPFLVLMVLAGNRHQREEEDSGHSHDDPEYEDGEGFEEDEEGEEGNEGGKAASTPLWKFVTKVEEGKGGGTVKFFCPHDCHNGKPFAGSYTRVRRHLCGVMDSDDRKGAIGITIFPKVSKEERQKYIKIEEAAQKKHGKKQKLHSDASSKFGGTTSPSPHGSGTSGSRRTIAISLILEVGMRWMQKWSGFSMLVVSHSMCFAPPIGMILSRESTKPLKDTRAPPMRKPELCYLTGKEQKFKEL